MAKFNAETRTVIQLQTPRFIEDWCIGMDQACPRIIEQATRLVPPHPKRIEIWQGYVLALATRLQDPKTILEIGTGTGFSAAVLALAAPEARVVTLTPDENHYVAATKNLSALSDQVSIRPYKSWEYWDINFDKWDMIWVDGDHAHIAWDLPWFNRLSAGGLMMFHDYTPSGCPRACPPVWDALHQVATHHPFDLIVTDDKQVGMVGFGKRPAERWTPATPRKAGAPHE